jgi:NAD(P)H-quinone oxidoreductase subunit 5
MLAVLPWLLVLGPLALIAAGLAAVDGRDPRMVAKRAIWAATLACALAAAAAIAVASHGALRAALPSLKGAGIGFMFDALSVVMYALVAFVGLIVVRYSRNYLDGDPGQTRF